MELGDLLATLLPFAAAYVAGAALLSWVILPYLGSRLDTGVLDGLLFVVVRGWLRLWHHPTWEGLEHIPAGWSKGMVVVANHASGVDPFLLQACLRRRIRWMMAEEQMLPALDAAWRHIEVIPITYGPADAGAFREAVRHVQRGGILGLFPEGGIVRPPNQVRPYLGGIGFLIARSKVPVALFLIEGTPQAATARETLFQPSRCRVRCLGWLDYSGTRDPAAINADLRRRMAEASGWPLNDKPLNPPPPDPRGGTGTIQP